MTPVISQSLTAVEFLFGVLAMCCNVGDVLQCWQCVVMLAMCCSVGNVLQCWQCVANSPSYVQLFFLFKLLRIQKLPRTLDESSTAGTTSEYSRTPLPQSHTYIIVYITFLVARQCSWNLHMPLLSAMRFSTLFFFTESIM